MARRSCGSPHWRLPLAKTLARWHRSAYGLSRDRPGGGADSVAIIAASTSVDVRFVMAMQMARFLAVLVIGPAAARFLARRRRVGAERLDRT
nr:AbrB family transcriptional regulator [Paraburkholderia lycopersici]